MILLTPNPITRILMGRLADAFREDMKPKKKQYQSDYRHRVGDRVEVLIKHLNRWEPGVMVGGNNHFINVRVAGDFEHIVKHNLVRKPGGDNGL